MASIQSLQISTSPCPANYTLPKLQGSVSSSINRTLLPAGPAYLAHLRLTRQHKNSFAELDKHTAAEKERLDAINGSSSQNGEDDLGVGDEEETEEILNLDPKEWKKQDHYAVLGLSHIRHKATPEQIKIAHRKKVLKHHPDKKASTPSSQSTSQSLLGINQNTNDDAFFKCIQKAHEVLTNPEKKRQFDSVDPAFLEVEDDVPTASEFKAKKLDFIKTFTPIFELRSRFSRVQPVPSLGALDASKEEVEGFYDFWYNFDSWRSFEWLDKEVNEGSDSRDDKRYTEKKNKSERARRKKEDTAKLRGIVDLTLSLDPRIARIKQQEKEARERKKRLASGSGTSTPKKTKEELEEEKKKKEEADKVKEEEDKAARAEAKKQKAAAANAAKKARRQQRAAEEEA